MEVDTTVKLTGDQETGATDTSTATSQWDPQLLQLPECSPVLLRGYVAEELFSLWLSLPDTARLVRSLIGDMQAGNPINLLGMATMNLSASGTSGSMFPVGSVPPLSPRGSSASPPSSMHKGSPFSRSPLKVVAEPVREVIPQFYFQNGRPPAKELKEQFISEINHFFNDHPDGLRINEFKFITREVFKLPSFLSYAIFSKIDTDCTGRVTRDVFAKYWVDSNFLTMDTATRLFNIIKHPNLKYLVPADFRAVLLELLATHPGLEFLQNSPEFQERYAETVIFRIFYHINRSGNSRLTLRELKRSDLIAALQHADQEKDINKVIRYFSYEHFYVIYCKFWELDADHDFLIDRESLIKYGNHALTYRIVDRIFSQAGRTFASKTEGKMNYEDFVYFMLSEEDKSSHPGLEYWFKCIDLDGNGILTPNEMQFFYEEQLHRMECMGQEPVLFEDILCQIVDMISPETEDCITLRDLLGSKLSGNVFNILFNLNKFIAFECRDPFLARQEQEDPTLTDWDRYAHKEYIRLTMEDAENWDESSMEAPF